LPLSINPAVVSVGILYILVFTVPSTSSSTDVVVVKSNAVLHPEISQLDTYHLGMNLHRKVSKFFEFMSFSSTVVLNPTVPDIGESVSIAAKPQVHRIRI
jgi:hypothetical protein